MTQLETPGWQLDAQRLTHVLTHHLVDPGHLGVSRDEGAAAKDEVLDHALDEAGTERPQRTTSHAPGHPALAQVASSGELDSGRISRFGERACAIERRLAVRRQADELDQVSSSRLEHLAPLERLPDERPL